MIQSLALSAVLLGGVSLLPSISQSMTHRVTQGGVVASIQERSSGSALRFVENAGQWPQNVRYLARLPGMIVRAECGSIVLDLPDISAPGRGLLVRLAFEGASQDGWVEGEGRLAGKHNFFLGNDPALWRSDVPAFSRVR